MIVRVLPVRLREEEIDERGRRLAGLVEEHRNIEQAKKDADANFNSDLKRTDSQISVLSRQVHTGTEDREVECIWEPNYGRGFAELRRADTMAVIETRGLTDEEKQKQLFSGQ